MWSKLLILALTVVFFLAVSVPALAHSGRISYLIDHPEEADEHPWGGGNENSDDPQLSIRPVEDPSLVQGRYYFIGIAVKYYWINVRNFIFENNQNQIPGTKSGTGAIPLELDNDTDNTSTGVRNQ
jgi:hypothetical protein